VRTLVETWRRTGLTEEQVILLLGPIAAWLHEHRPLGLLSEEELRSRIHGGLCAWEGYVPEGAPASLERTAMEFIETVRRESGIILARGEGLYGFVHLSFQEYFAARYIARQTMKLCEALTKHAADSRWHEPLVLAIGHVAREMTGEVTQVLDHLLELEIPHEDLLGRGLLVCLGALAECVWIPPNAVRKIVSRTLAIYGEAVAAGRARLWRRIAVLFAPLRAGPFATMVEGMLVERATDGATVHLVREAKWFTRRMIAILLSRLAAGGDSIAQVEAALHAAGDAAAELFPDTLGVRDAARRHEAEWLLLMAQPNLGSALRGLVTPPISDWFWERSTPTGPDIITRETVIDDPIRRALGSIEPIQELLTGCKDLCSRRASGWEEAAALIAIGWGSLVELDKDEWYHVLAVSRLDTYLLTSILENHGIAFDDRHDHEDYEPYWDEEDEPESVDEAASSDERPEEVERALVELNS